MKIIKIKEYHMEAAKGLIKVSKMLNKKIDKDTIKIANATYKPNPNLPEQETQYIIED